MKKLLFTLVTTTFASTLLAQTYQVNLQSNVQSGIAYLTYHLGSNLNVEDSAAISQTGLAVFKGNKTLPPGIYAIVFPGKKLSADFLIGNEKKQNITIKADTSNLINMQVSGSPEDVLFRQYQQYVGKQGKLLNQERQAFLNAGNKEDSTLHEQKYLAYNTELNNYRMGIITQQPNSMMAILLNAMRESPYPTKKPITRQDSIDNYQFYKSHYWDGISFMDDGVVRTPFFKTKLENYYREVMPQSPDSIIKDIDYKLLLARNAPEVYKYMLNWLTDEYINPKYMGQDAVFVHLFNKYHSKGLTNWLNEKQMDAITRRAYMLMANLVGEQAANLELIDINGKLSPLYNVKADFTVVSFWDPNCGHCKEEMPRIDSLYKANWKNKNVQIYAVMTEADTMAWKKYIADHNLGYWTNVYQSLEMMMEEKKQQQPSFKQLYDITQTPTLYLLDKDKRIIAKKLTPLQLNEMLEAKWKTRQ
ncbi:MAG: redoxin domain-containing protein [Chitinophagaceae bacterium]|nr:MAG: redoxin domain-containing protein [Chitinophagaceae bacterium]